jgi:uncharacterized protein
MQYRDIGKTGVKASALGFGIMRLPGWEQNQLDEEASLEMVEYAIDQGVNYLDTAYPYISGLSEPFVGKVLNRGYRDKVMVATKLPQWEVKEYEDFDRFLSEQLARLTVEQVNFYLLHAMNGLSWQRLLALGVTEWMDEIVADGRVKHIGFSFHDDYAAFETIVKGYDWDFCQIQYNYLDTERQAGTIGLQLAASLGLGVIVMEPLLGGTLANLPATVDAIFREEDSERTPVDWALQWLWDQPEVSVVLSGMGTLQQVQENLASASRSREGSMTDAEKAVIQQAAITYHAMRPIGCTNCHYCMPCPSGVQIPRIFEFYNHGAQGDYWYVARGMYHDLLAEGQRADQCIACGACERVCPQQLAIIDWLKVSHRMLNDFSHTYDPSLHPDR